MNQDDAPLLLPAPTPTPEEQRERALALVRQAARNALATGMLPSQVSEIVNTTLRQVPR